MQSAISEYYMGEDGRIRLFITGMDEGLSPGTLSVLAGMEECSVTSQGSALGNVPFRTLLMVDNSRSVPGFERAKELLHRILDAHAPGEEFCLVTFDSRLTGVTGEPGQFSTDYELLSLAVDSMTQADRSTEVNAALLQALQEKASDGSFQRIILISDGGDRAGTGSITLQEVEEQLDRFPVRIHTIGTLWENRNAYGLDDMAALGRRYGSYHSLDETGASEGIPEILSLDYNTVFLDARLPADVQDGSIRSILVEDTSADNSYHISRDIRMPQKAVPQAAETPVPTKAVTPTPTSVPVTETAEISTEAATEYSESISIGRYVEDHAFFLGGAFLFLGCALGAAVLILRKRKGESAEVPGTLESPDDFDGTELYMDPQEDELPEDCETQMMFAKPVQKNCVLLCLSGVEDPGSVLKASLTGSMILGSSGRFSEIVIPGDPTVSRRHARFTLDGGRVLVEDLDSTNGTWLNREPLHGSMEIQNGDLLRFGDSELTVSLEENSAGWQITGS